MRNCYAWVTLEVTPRIASSTQGYASYYFSLRGSYIREEGAISRRFDRLRLLTHIGTHITGGRVTRVTRRPARKKQPLLPVTGYALKRNQPDWRPTQ